MRKNNIINALEAYGQAIFIKGYVDSYPKYRSSLAYALLVSNACLARASRYLQTVKLNPIEQKLFKKLRGIYNGALEKIDVNTLDIVIGSNESVEKEDAVRQLILTTLSLMGLYKEPVYPISVVTLVDNNDEIRVKTIRMDGINLDTIDRGSFVERMYKGSSSSYRSKQEIVLALIDTVNIRMMPDITTGIGITKISAIDAIGNLSLNERMLSKSLENAFDTFILDMVSERTKVYYPALEAVEDEETDTPDDADTDNEPQEDNAEGKTDSGSDQTSGDTNSPEGDQDNADDTVEKAASFFKAGLDLAKDETMDDLLYKISVARLIYDLTESNAIEDKRISNLLKLWVNQLLFITSAKNTRKLLSILKIKTK